MGRRRLTQSEPNPWTIEESMPKVKTAVAFIALVSSSFSASLVMNAQPSRGKKTVTLKGIIFRGDKQHPVANALILLMNAKESEGQGSSVEAKKIGRASCRERV